jgi:hypothetical protein
MKKRAPSLIVAALLAAPPFLHAQQPQPGFVPNPPGYPGAGPVPQRFPPQTQPEQQEQMQRFDLDFRGGTPQQLVKAIEQATGRPLNAIIADDYANMQIPALKMRSVNVPELFEALGSASRKTVQYVTGSYFNGGSRIPQYSQMQTYYGFSTEGRPNPDSIWHFFSQAAPAQLSPTEPIVCRYFQLAPYLASYKVEDITTAIQTGWKMLGDSSPPKISFHKDTMLLIAVGDPEKLKLIDSVLAQLNMDGSVDPNGAPIRNGAPKKP